MHDPNRHLGPKNRKGYNTTHRTKLEACARFKSLVESGKLQILSKNLIHELKYFIAKGNSYEATLGENDDLIMAMMLNIRMIQHIATWDNDIYTTINTNVSGRFEDDSDDMPFPMLVI